MDQADRENREISSKSNEVRIGETFVFFHCCFISTAGLRKLYGVGRN